MREARIALQGNRSDSSPGEGSVMNGILLFAFLVAGSPSQPNDTDVRVQLERRYAELARATERRDLPGYLAIRHETFHSISPDGRITSPTEMSEYSKQFFAGLL